ncbi:ExbD/TolR family protein, partial [Oceaniglobus roseus]|uniref:ExbD/TolR family protein n=1 Tax=Oceaniglobus roseus TaxID=1737570 RepID=UPI001562C0D6
MRLQRSPRQAAAISLVAMIDVLMILLVFFMVTSTYLDLDMVPLAGTEAPAASAPAAARGAPARLLVRLGG